MCNKYHLDVTYFNQRNAAMLMDNYADVKAHISQEARMFHSLALVCFLSMDLLKSTQRRLSSIILMYY